MIRLVEESCPDPGDEGMRRVVEALKDIFIFSDGMLYAKSGLREGCAERGRGRLWVYSEILALSCDRVVSEMFGVVPVYFDELITLFKGVVVAIVVFFFCIFVFLPCPSERTCFFLFSSSCWVLLWLSASLCAICCALFFAPNLRLYSSYENYKVSS